MKTLTRIPLICAAVLFAVLQVATCRSQKSPDAWEARHNSYQPPEQVMDSVGVEPGMVIAEVGAGRGRYVVHMARRVGQTGRVYANDINKKALDYLAFRCKRDSIPNVVTIRGAVTDPHLPAGKLDLVYIINTYHHLEKPAELLENIRPGLKHDGRLAIIEHDPLKVPEAGSHSTARETVLGQAKLAGYELVKIQTFLPRDNIYIFRVQTRAH
jgi:ubiquinone/menaquinone biosynthesis C-methylase UbiE